MQRVLLIHGLGRTPLFTGTTGFRRPSMRVSPRFLCLLLDTGADANDRGSAAKASATNTANGDLSPLARRGTHTTCIGFKHCRVTQAHRDDGHAESATKAGNVVHAALVVQSLCPQLRGVSCIAHSLSATAERYLPHDAFRRHGWSTRQAQPV